MIEIKHRSTGRILHRVDASTLVGVDLHAAKLVGADLRAANLRDADLQDADLQDADLQDADLQDAVYSLNTRWPEGFAPWRSGARLAIRGVAESAAGRASETTPPTNTAADPPP